MPAANHAFYLRHCYLENQLFRGEMELDGVQLDLKKVKIADLQSRDPEDHIAPARLGFSSARRRSAARSTSSSPARATSPASSTRRREAKYQFWTGGPPKGKYADWVAKAQGRRPARGGRTGTPGSTRRRPERVPTREPGGGKLAPLGDAPGGLCEGEGLTPSTAT